MTLESSDAPDLNAFEEAVRAGHRSSCPFCLGIANPDPPAGEELVFICVSEVGQRARVVDELWQGGRPGFLLAMDNEREGWFRIVTPGIDYFVLPDALGQTDWIPPLSIEDNIAVHRAILDGLIQPPARRSDYVQAMAKRLASTCWHRRLPLSGEEVWLTLSAHGAPGQWRDPFVDSVSFGIGLLVASRGRSLNGRRRMAPFAKARYLTERERELRLRLFGRD